MESETQEKTMPLGDRLIVAGNMLGSLSIMMISIGAILRTQELPETPIFINTGSPLPPTRPVGINPSSSYWDR